MDANTALTGSMLQTSPDPPRHGSQSGTSETKHSLQIVGKCWRTILQIYNPPQAFFDQTWQPSEIEPI